MSTVNSFDKSLNLAELNQPLFGVNPTPMTPAARRAAARSNINVQEGVQAGYSGARLSNGFVQNLTISAVNTSATLTAAQIIGGLITSTTAAAVVMTLPTGTNFETALIAAFPGLQNGDAFQFYVSNLGGTNAITFAAGTNFTIASAASTSVGANSGVSCVAVRTSANNYVLYFA